MSSETPRLRAVCFDFDGTLAYMEPPHIDLYVQAACEHGITLTAQAVRDGLGAGWQRWQTEDGVDHSAHSASADAFRAVRVSLHVDRLRAAGAEGDVEGAAGRLAELEEDASYYRLYDDSAPALRALAERGVRLVVVSNHIWALPEIVQALGIGDLFTAVLTSARVGYRKPHPRFYAEALREADAAPAETLFVGDSFAADVEGPRRVGMRAVLLDREGRSSDPDAIRSLRDLPLA